MMKTVRKGAEKWATFVKIASACLGFDLGTFSPSADTIFVSRRAKNDHLLFLKKPRKVLLRFMLPKS